MKINKDNVIIYAVDDDASMRKSLVRLLKSAGFKTEAFASAEQFLKADIRTDKLLCLISDIRMPGMTGMELQEEINKKDVSMPIVFITGHGDIPMSVSAMKKGAVDFLKKPFDQRDLLDAVDAALLKSAKNREDMDVRQKAVDAFEKLTSREKEIFTYIITGMLNKQIAYALGISEKTVKAHRGQVTEKLNMCSVAEMVRFAEVAGVEPAECDIP